MSYSPRILEAVSFAYALHREQARKGSGAPYITHPMGVAALVGEYGGDEEQFIAALLHDTIEDGGGAAARAEIEQRFGRRVAELVWACSDTDAQPKPPWRARKEAHIAHAAHADPAAKLILAADKCHNVRAVTAGLRAQGPALWDHFKGGREGTLWYYEAMRGALAEGWAHPILAELDDAIANLMDLIGGRD